MKTLNLMLMKAGVAIMALLALAFLSNCDNGNADPGISKRDQVKEILTTSPWKVNTVSVDGVDRTITYKDLGLTFSESGFSAVGGGAIWPTSGTWSFTTAEATAFRRDDGLEVTIQEATPTALKLALIWSRNTIAPGRTESVRGSHIFEFRK